MNRRHFLAALTAMALLSSGAARADDGLDYIDDIVEWLEDTGFTEIVVTHSLLGRIVITAHLGDRIREIACNPRTGEILRDVWLNDTSGARPPALPDDLLDHDDDDDHGGKGGGNDNSGHVGGNSGRGGGDDD